MSTSRARISEYFQASIEVLDVAICDQSFTTAVMQSASMIIEAFEMGKKVLIAGNGGSAADAQHLATELMVRFHLDRAPLPALALGTDSTALTATGNDLGFEQGVSR